ncbi:hypothetical protein [Paenibacillus phocaensis]|uniref:hypothetical protein n=1 Tax=Paenibacillus phocaensis TaxID=1776378 RepID=UPI000839B97B|nr:hypothetical protein [Paenibacillus phocaensis]
MRYVMVRAWEIARDAVAKFGGKVKEYFAQALAQAWKEVKAIMQRYEVILDADTKKCRTWLAKIVGTHPVYKLDRKFLMQDGETEYGRKVFKLSDGYYESFNGKRRQLFKVVDGEYFEMTMQEMQVAVADSSF